MTREEKSQVIEELTAQLADNTNIYLADISGLDAGNTSNLRRACFKAGVKLAVVKNTLLEKDLVQATEMLVVDLNKNTEFRIKWPRGEMGSLPADSEQFMLIEDLYKTVEKMEEHIEGMMNNKLEIGFLKEQVKKAKEDIEKLKDADREIVYKNGNGTH